MEATTLVSVRNRNNGSTGYKIPETGVQRIWEKVGETKKIPFSELQQLSYLPGGQYLLDNILVVEDNNALEALSMQVEPEYKYTEEDIKAILLGTSDETLDQLEDFLNFSPSGGIELAKDLAVKLQIPDTRKREMISKKTNFNIENAININKMMAEDLPEEKQEAPTRKATPVNVESSVPARKSVPKYNVVTKK